MLASRACDVDGTVSIIVAVKGEGCVYLAADSQATNGESKLILDPKHGKLRQLTPQLAVGCTECMNQLDVLQQPSRLTQKPMEWRDYATLEEAARSVWQRVVDGLGDRMEKNRDTGAAELPGRLLIAWKDDFIEVDASGQLIKTASDWHAIGSGAEVARGAFHSIESFRYQLRALPDGSADEAMAGVVVEAACTFNIYCSLPVITAVTRV
jgi:ATP-dependent protease HslVU (ClpYQ) peptidase subunit